MALHISLNICQKLASVQSIVQFCSSISDSLFVESHSAASP